MPSLLRLLGLCALSILGLLSTIATSGNIRFCEDDDCRFPADESPSGIYLQGEFTSTVTGLPVAHQVTAIISESYDTQIVSADLHYAGTVDTDRDVLTGTLTQYLGSRGPFWGFEGIRQLKLDGTVDSTGIFGDYTGDDDRGRFNLVYSSLYERRSSLAAIAGVWTFSQASSAADVYTVTFTIDGNGELFGSDTTGCVFNGRINIIDDQYNAYRATAGISSCGEADGDYTGLAYLSDIAGTLNNQLTYSISNESYAFRVVLQ